MTTSLNPYLHFPGTARAAMDFYHSVFGGELTRSTFGEFQMSQEPADQDLIMHSALNTDSGLALMGADIPSHMDQATPGDGISVSLSGDDHDELQGYWDKLSADGTVEMPLEKAPWGDSFGMCKDSFGINWMVNITGSGPGS
jgi:PhnB protein